jgi:succinate-acetate transporter protein
MIFLSLVGAFGCLSGAYWNLALGNTATATRCQTAGGALSFITCVCGWYLFTVQILASVDFPINLPVVCSAARPFNLRMLINATGRLIHGDQGWK